MSSTLRRLASLASLILPGSGQALRGRVGDALLFLWAALWLHVLALGVLTSVYTELEREGLAFAFGAFGVPRGFAIPEATVFTLFALALHLFAAVDAYRKGDARPRPPAGITGRPAAGPLGRA